MQLTSPAFKHEGQIPLQYTCDGDNISPRLDFSGVPEGAVSLALIMEDPDVPKPIREDGMWNHWLVWNMPAGTPAIDEGAEPPGMVGVNTGRKRNYQGPCPPDREHRYFFKLYALDAELDLPPEATKEELLAAMDGHILAQAELMGRYERQSL